MIRPKDSTSRFVTLAYLCEAFGQVWGHSLYVQIGQHRKNHFLQICVDEHLPSRWHSLTDMWSQSKLGFYWVVALWGVRVVLCVFEDKISFPGFIVGSAQLWNRMNSANNLDHVFPFIGNFPALRYTVRFLAGAVILGPITLITRKFLLRCFVYLNNSSNVEDKEAKKLKAIELPYKFLTTLFSGFISTAYVPCMLQHYKLW